jgi:hypothetical protein
LLSCALGVQVNGAYIAWVVGMCAFVLLLTLEWDSRLHHSRLLLACNARGLATFLMVRAALSQSHEWC